MREPTFDPEPGAAGRPVPNEYAPISDYALIGDCHTAALVSRDGSLDWLCLPRFDGPAVFCRLLDARIGGSFQVGPVGAIAAERTYERHSNVLVMTFVTPTGRVRLTDFMPYPRTQRAVDETRVLRLVECLEGRTEIAIRFRPTFDYARAPTTVALTDVGGVGIAGDQRLHLFTRVPLRKAQRGALAGRARLRAGERLWCELAHAGPDPTPLTDAQRSEQLAETVSAWQRWMGRCSYRGPYRAAVCRSELALKLLTYDPTGAVIASPTTSLPEALGGERNWDYRFTWLRDSALILYALQTVGFHDEAMRFFGWLERLGLHRRRRLQILYRVDGVADATEALLPHLEGYRRSAPVRIGNAAARQVQLDVFGHVLDAAHLCFERVRPVARPLWNALGFLADEAAARWTEPDRGIWEVRGRPRHFVHSKLMCWVALDRALKLLPGHVPSKSLASWRAARARIRRAILTEGYDSRVGAFTQALGERTLDASVLAIPLVGFLPASDRRVQSTTQTIRDRLTSKGLVYRYEGDDGLAGSEGAFTVCTFWLVDNLALGGRLDEAQALFERVTSCANDVGLLSEQIDPRTGEMLGNFPQGYSHMALIRSALNVARAERLGPERRARTLDQRAKDLERAGVVARRSPYVPGGTVGLDEGPIDETGRER